MKHFASASLNWNCDYCFLQIVLFVEKATLHIIKCFCLMFHVKHCLPDSRLLCFMWNIFRNGLQMPGQCFMWNIKACAIKMKVECFTWNTKNVCKINHRCFMWNMNMNNIEEDKLMALVIWKEIFTKEENKRHYPHTFVDNVDKQGNLPTLSTLVCG